MERFRVMVVINGCLVDPKELHRIAVLSLEGSVNSLDLDIEIPAEMITAVCSYVSFGDQLLITTSLYFSQIIRTVPSIRHRFKERAVLIVPALFKLGQPWSAAVSQDNARLALLNSNFRYRDFSDDGVRTCFRSAPLRLHD